MKSKLKIIALSFVFAALTLVGCKKEIPGQVAESFDLSSDEIQSLSLQTQTESSELVATVNYETGELVLESEGLAADYLVELTDLEIESSSASTSSVKGSSKKSSLIRCLLATKPDSVQMRLIRKSLGDYQDCKSSSIKRARAIYDQLRDKYQALIKVQIALFKNNQITKAELEVQIKKINKAFNLELRRMHIEEKLDHSLKTCYESFLRQIHTVLNDNQWKAFVACHRK